MKIIFIFLLLYEYVEGSKQKEENFTKVQSYKFTEFDRKSSISKAFNEVIDEFFIKQEIQFDVLIIEPISSNFPDIIDLTLTNIKNSRPVLVKSVNPRKVAQYSQNSSAVIFVDWSINKNLNLTNFIKISKTDPKKLRFLLYFSSCTNIEANEILKINEVKLIAIQLYGFFICHQNDKILNLLTHEWFGPISCNKKQIKILNSFNLVTQSWRKSLKNYQKFKNFHGCHLKFRDYHYDDTTTDFSAPLKNTSILTTMAQKGNFTFEFVDTDNFTEIFLMPGFTFVFESYALTTLFRVNQVGLIVTQGEPYSDYEKLLLPFDELTWILFLGTFALAFAFIFCINRMKKPIREIFFGEGVTMPSFNVVGTFFGIGQTKLPEAFFSRYILMMFIIFCLIFRTSYQGILFEFMNTDMRKPHAKTFDEVYENYFTIFIHTTTDADTFTAFMFKENKKLKEKIINIEYEGMSLNEGICEVIKENKPKIAIPVGPTLFLIVNSICEKKPIKLQETFFTVPVGIATDSLHYIYEVLEDTIQLLIPSGILEHSDDFFFWSLFREKYFEVDEGPKVLAISDLSYGFNIWLITCIFAIVEFVLEIFVHKILLWTEMETESKTSKINEQKSKEKRYENDLKKNDYKKRNTKIEKRKSNKNFNQNKSKFDDKNKQNYDMIELKTKHTKNERKIHKTEFKKFNVY